MEGHRAGPVGGAGSPTATPPWWRRPGLRRAVVSGVVVLVLAAFGYALVDAWRATDGDLPSAGRLLGAGAIWLVGLVCGGWAWGELLGGSRRRHAGALIVSQLGKYVPGGVVQATGQVTLARAAGVPLGRAAAAYWVLAMVQALAGCLWAIVLAATWTDGSAPLRLAVGVGGALGLALLDRRWMVWALAKVPRARESAAGLVPSQRAILRAWVASTGALGSASAAYFVLLGSFGEVRSPVFVLAGYASAWTVGFLAVPIPSGLGVREAALAALLVGHLQPSVLVATSVYLRLAMIATEGLAALALLPVVRSGMGERSGTDRRGVTR